MTPYNEIFSLNQNGLNHSQIETVLGGTVTRKTIISALRLADEYGFHYSPGSGLTDAEIHRILHPKKDKESRMPNMAQVLFALSLPDQSVASVWKKYIHKNPGGYSKTKFQSLIREYRGAYPISEYRQGVYLRYIKDALHRENGSSVNCLFAQVRHSKKAFVIIINNNKPRSWVHGLVKLIREIGGAPSPFVFLNRIPKSLSGITQDCLAFYDIAIEQGNSKTASGFDLMIKDTLAQISEETNCETEEKVRPIWALHQTIRKSNEVSLLEGFAFSVEEAFRLEACYFNHLPKDDYDLTEYTDIYVQPNRHVEIDGNYYSVPFDYRHEKLTAYITDHYIDICYLDTVICTHERFDGKTGKYSTDGSHLVPDSMVPFGELSGKSLRSWAKKIGPNTEKAIDYLLRIRSYEIQGYKVCDTLLHYSTKYSSALLEEACSAAINAKEITYSFISEYCKSLQPAKE